MVPHVLQVAAAGVASIALMNFSLQINSVGTYQLMKVCPLDPAPRLLRSRCPSQRRIAARTAVPSRPCPVLPLCRVHARQLLVIPTVMAIEYVTSGKTTPLQEKLCLVVLLLGVGISTVTDVALSQVRGGVGICAPILVYVCWSPSLSPVLRVLVRILEVLW